MKSRAFTRYSIFVLLINLVVVLWGAVVRATGSGAGCGSHWPTCNGVVIPLDRTVETTIEFVHRLSSGAALLLVVGLFIWGMRLFAKGSPVRLGIILSLVFIITEALVGAGLVLYGWVADDDSPSRTLVIAVHLVNTFLLLAALTLTSWWSMGRGSVRLPSARNPLGIGLLLGLLGVILIGISGAITALGDTLFPAGSLSEGFAQDLDPNSHFLIQLRVWHPVIAVVTGFYILFLSARIASLRPEKDIKRFAWVLGGLFVLQLAAGIVNLILLAPVWMQIVHLLLADLVWISLILLSAATLEAKPASYPIESKSPEKQRAYSLE